MNTRASLFATIALFSSGALVFAQGNDCSSATTLTGDLTTSFATSGSGTSGFNGGGSCSSGASSIFADVFFQWTATVTGEVSFDTVGSNYDTKLSVHAGTGCAASCVGYNDDTSGLQSLVTVANVVAGDTFLVQVGGYGSSSGNAVLNIFTYVDPCLSMPDDPFENNDTCAMATPLPVGTFVDLFATAADPDNYLVCVEPGGVLDVNIDFQHNVANLDLYLWAEGSPGCVMGAAGTGSLTSSATSSSFEALTWTNTGAASVNVILEVVMGSPTNGICSSYDLTIMGAGNCGGPFLLNSFCDPMNANSTGSPTALVASMNPGVGSGIHLEASSGPPGQFAQIVVSSGMSDPGISVGQGRLCIGVTAGSLLGRFNIEGSDLNSLGRFDGAGVMQNLVGTSQVGTGFDVPITMPVAGGHTTQVGSTWHYQTWHRDLTGSSNFSNGVTVRF